MVVSRYEVPLIDWSRKLDRKERLTLSCWLFGTVMLSGAVAVNVFDGFHVGRFRGALDIALTGSAIYCTAKATQKCVEFGSVGYRNEAQRHMDEAIEETAVAYQWQITDLQTRWQQYVAQLVAQHQQRVQALEHQHKTQIEDLMSQLSDRIIDAEVLEEKVMHLKAQNFHEQEQAKADAEEAREYLENDRRAIQQMHEELALSEQHLEAREQQMKQEAEQIWRAERDRLQAEQQRLEAYQTQLDRVDEQYRQEAMQMAQEAVMAELERKNQEIETLKDQVNAMAEMVAQLRIPTFIEGSSRAALLANEVIRALKELNIVLLETGVWNEAGNPDIVIIQGKVSPANPDGRLANYCTVLGHVVPFLNKSENLGFIQGAIADCNTLPKVRSVSGNKLELVLDVSGVDREAIKRQQAEAEKYFAPTATDEHIIQFIQENPHTNIMADSGCGKTTLINNIIGLCQSEFGGQATIRYTNPKPATDTDGPFIDWIGETEAIYGLLEAAIEIVYRVNHNNNVIRQNQQRPKGDRLSFQNWEPLICFIDEMNLIASAWNRMSREALDGMLATVPNRLQLEGSRLQALEEVTRYLAPSTVVGDLIKFCWRVGRSEKIKLIVAGQNLMPSQLSSNLTKRDSYQQAYICAGNGIGLAMHELVKPQQKERLQKDLERVRRSVEDGRLSQFNALFYPKESEPYFAELPKPNTYSSGVNGDHAETVEIVAEAVEPSDRGKVQVLDSNRNVLKENKDSEPNFESVLNLEPENLNQIEPLSDKGYSGSAQASSISAKYPQPRVQPGLNSRLNPLNPKIEVSTRTRVIEVFLTTQSVVKTIEEVWDCKKGGSKKYRVAKWKFRHILNDANIDIPGRSFGTDALDSQTLDELLAGK